MSKKKKPEKALARTPENEKAELRSKLEAMSTFDLERATQQMKRDDPNLAEILAVIEEREPMKARAIRTRKSMGG